MPEHITTDGRRPGQVQSDRDEARVVVSFGAGPAGVGPISGVESGEFYPSPRSDDRGDTEPDRQPRD